VPIDLLAPILEAMLATGRPRAAAPWLASNATEIGRTRGARRARARRTGRARRRHSSATSYWRRAAQA
jgi:hypothetical protein